MFKAPRKALARRLALPFFGIGMIGLSGCASLADIMVDCIDGDGPVISPASLPNAVVGEPYLAVLTTSIRNEPYDDRFRYRITLSSGLPDGLSAEIFHREVRIVGVPSELDISNFIVEVDVSDSKGANTAGLCRHTKRREYALTVQEELTLN